MIGLSIVCSTKFCIIVFNEAIDIINMHGITGQGFADDCDPLIGGSDRPEKGHSYDEKLSLIHI